MKNNTLFIIKTIPVWKAILYVLLSLIASAVTATILLSSLYYFQKQFGSVAFIVNILSSLWTISILSPLFFGLILFSYLFLFYRVEKKRYVSFEFNHMIREVELIANGNFNHKVEERAEAGLNQLAVHINNVVIQARKAIEEERRSEQIKNDLVTNVAHDLRSPLTSIIGYLNLINEDGYRDEVELRAYIQIVNAKAERLHHLINDLFEYTYVQNKETLVSDQSINIEEMINQLVVQHRIQIQAANMQMRTFIKSDNPVIVGDGNKIARVFENLIQNAMRYGKEGKYIDLIVRDSEQTVEVEVKNYGKSIPSVDLPYIFERFYRVEKSRSEYTGGSGLGLAIAKSIVTLHGGDIEAKSAMGTTSFVVRLLKKR
ncbi:cell wall metabolism sensor histidine kinase WalK [Paenibacillus sp. NFR01]|uniref:sensor histidine kinase n=1 Tax=Paenibacillus sp. NFR01 TaxID=1566279 RepID=UPI0008D2826F|nr:ATP-binding protein [Paenibacillus sp. NFR01]SEU09228.1 His Kinase A (phospho-acceptor) domain-containing protein [Paenibacillus sp. NFR01]